MLPASASVNPLNEIKPLVTGAGNDTELMVDRDNFTGQKRLKDLETVQRFARGSGPISVRVSDFSKLYRAYGVQTYW